MEDIAKRRNIRNIILKQELIFLACALFIGLVLVPQHGLFVGAKASVLVFAILQPVVLYVNRRLVKLLISRK